MSKYRFVECEEMKDDERFKLYNRCNPAEKSLHFVRLLKAIDKKESPDNSVIGAILKEYKRLLKKTEDGMLAEDADFGLNVKSILKAYELIDKNDL